MTVQVNKEITAVVTENKSPVFGNNKFKYRYFQALFPERRVLLLLGDALVVIMAVLAALLLWHQTANTGLTLLAYLGTHWYWLLVLLNSWWILAWFNDLYHVPSSFDRMRSAMRVAMVGLISLVFYLVISSLMPNYLSDDFFLYYLAIVWPAITFWRWIYATLFSHLPYRVVIVGSGERGQLVAKILQQASKLNYQVLGYVDDNRAKSQTVNDGLPALGEAADLPKLVRRLQIQEVVVAIDHRLKKNLFEWLVECQANGVRVSLMSDLYEELYRKIPVEYIDPDWAVQVMQQRPVLNRFGLGLKRLLDLVLVMGGLLVLAPLLPLVALAIHLDSPGPIFYRQIRCGRAGKHFSIIKFRTMRSDAEKDGKARWAVENDDRITRVGRFLRKTRLDELPQVINVLRGEMSIIGPRPERPEFVEALLQEIPYYRVRLMVKPGLTGWAQVNYDYGNSVDDALVKLQYDFYYLRYWSLWLDLYIIFRTFSVVFKFKGT